MRIAFAVVAYEAAPSIEALLDRIPPTIAGLPTVVLVSDDASTDNTAELAEKWAARRPEIETVVLRNETNLGYGGNQKFIFKAAHDLDVDIAILLHGDGQYPPELGDELVESLVRDEADAAHGSRMILRGGARRGGMPIDRFLGNVTLTRLLNLASGAHLSEWFTGFRAYRVPVLVDLDIDTLSDGFDFDISITMRLIERGYRITEIAIPTRYGDEISRVPLIRTGVSGITHSARFAAQRARRALRRSRGH